LESIREIGRKYFVMDGLLSDDFLDFLKANKEPYDRLMAYYRCAMMVVQTRFRVLNEEYSLEYDRNPIEDIKTRLKSTDSLLRKVRDRNVPLTLEAIEENITDIAGVRVICAFPEDIYRLAETFLQQDDIVLVQRKDYFQTPKANGYRSLHLIVEVPIYLQNEKRQVKVEVQFRTIAMDFWASIEHKLFYKKNIPVELKAELARELRECAEESAALDLRMQTLRDRIAETQQELGHKDASRAQRITERLIEKIRERNKDDPEE